MLEGVTSGAIPAVLLIFKHSAGFEAQQQQETGTRSVPWRKTATTTCRPDGIYVAGGGHMSIISMPEYAGSSFEELRWGDYQVCCHGSVCKEGI